MKIEFDDIELAFEFVSSLPRSTNSALLSTATGQIYFISDYGDSDELPEDFDEATHYIEIPHKNDLDLGIALVRDFVWQHIPDHAEEVEGFFRRKGAYGRFKDFLERKELLESWYEFEKTRTESALRTWCAKHDIEVI